MRCDDKEALNLKRIIKDPIWFKENCVDLKASMDSKDTVEGTDTDKKD